MAWEDVLNLFGVIIVLSGAVVAFVGESVETTILGVSIALGSIMFFAIAEVLSRLDAARRDSRSLYLLLETMYKAQAIEVEQLEQTSA